MTSTVISFSNHQNLHISGETFLDGEIVLPYLWKRCRVASKVHRRTRHSFHFIFTSLKTLYDFGTLLPIPTKLIYWIELNTTIPIPKREITIHFKTDLCQASADFESSWVVSQHFGIFTSIHSDIYKCYLPEVLQFHIIALPPLCFAVLTTHLLWYFWPGSQQTF